MKKILILLFIMVFAISSCKDYLDVVPDEAETLESLYATRESAWDGLAKIYSYLPNITDADLSPWLLGDEYMGRRDWDSNNNKYLPIRIMRGLQNEESPILGYWSGTRGGNKLYEGIRQCNIFIDHIHLPSNMDEAEREDWKAQAKFLKAYYHFLLIQQYGPIVIRDESLSLEAPPEELYQNRSKLEDCFDYVVSTMDEAIPYLKDQSLTEDSGQIDKIGAKAIKARVLLFRASPFYNGNSDYYSNFLDSDDEPFFPQVYDINKWKDVIDACNDALVTSVEFNKGLFRFEGEPYLFDRDAFEINNERMQTLYDLRLVITTPWNKELLWGYSNLKSSNGDGGWNTGRNAIYGRTQIRFWSVMQTVMGAFTGYSGNNDDVENFANQHLGATYAMAERYYTQNGLPLNEDTDFNLDFKYFQYDIPEAEDPAYAHWAGYLQPDMETIYLFMNREPRFYANLGINGGYWRGHYFLIPFNPYYSTDEATPIPRGDTGKVLYPFGGRETWRKTNDYLETCIGIQKFVHPESYSGNWTRIQRSPFPIIRFADLLLMKAEALNELYGPTQEAFDAIDAVRARAGIPSVEEAWGANGKARNTGKHLTQQGLRDIILQERGIELAFEGSRFYDMLRHKRAPKEFSKPVYGWNNNAVDIGAQTGSGPELKQIRNFTITDCLWPISIGELNIQGGLIQNPGWR
ncbi:MAG: RagB/SusD family nutrient uptake outer membrane protein [Parabacteroides sp.]|nr:RagB/SusD family nutrient uptake outer membrane protein [Parabacteroides sp.]